MLPLSNDMTNRILQQAMRYLSQGQISKAKAGFLQLARAQTARPEVYFNLSRIAFEEGDREACLTNLRRAVALDPKSVKLGRHAADRFRRFGAEDDALAAYDRLIAGGDNPLRDQADKAHYLQLLGRFDEAEAIFRKLISKNPDEAQLYRIFLATRTTRPGDPLLRQMERLWKRKTLKGEPRAQLGFALGKALDEAGETDRAAPCIAEANAIQRELAPYDRDAQDREFARVIAAQESLPAPAANAAPATPRPVFVTGMPRSGTTLVERILSAHSDVSAGGELGLALRLAYGVFGAGEKMADIAAADPAKIKRFGTLYSRFARRDVPGDSPVITDKSILSYLVTGLIHSALPGARIIVVQRDPRDIALSIWRNHFPTGVHRYGNDLADIAHAIKRFRAQVDQWKTALPGVIHEIRYEDLVAEPEAQSRALVSAAGLDWQDACLDFHTQTSAVRTLSVSQVRQPIYTGSAEGWRKHEAALQPFFDAWGDTPWD